MQKGQTDKQTHALSSIYRQLKFLMPFLIPFALLCWLCSLHLCVCVCERERERGVEYGYFYF